MDLRRLQYLLAVADAGHFTRASERVHVTQPALSQQIRRLEEEVGAVLLDRAAHPVQLTAAGEALAYHARRALQELADARVAIDELAGLKRGTLTVGVVQTVNAYLLPRVVAAFVSAYPGVRLRVEERAAGEIERGVVDGTLQLGVSFVPVASEGVEAEPLFTEDLVLVAAADHPLARLEDVPVDALRDTGLILLPPSYCTRRLWDDCAAQAGIAPVVLAEVNTIGGVLAAVRAARAATVLPALALEDPRADGLIARALRNPTPRRTVGLLFRQNGHRCTATLRFADAIRTTLPAEV